MGPCVRRQDVRLIQLHHEHVLDVDKFPVQLETETAFAVFYAPTETAGWLECLISVLYDCFSSAAAKGGMNRWNRRSGRNVQPVAFTHLNLFLPSRCSFSSC